MFTCRRILVPLDGSELAERALPPAFAIAEALSAAMPCGVHLLRVVPPLMLTIDPLLYAETLSLTEEEAQNYLTAVETHWSHAHATIPITTHHLTGPAADSIVAYAQEQKIDLIVMSSHGRSGLSRWVYGSVAEKIMRQSCCATLIIRQGEPEQPVVFHKILVCLDGSPLAEEVLPPILTLARALHAELTLLRVVSPAHLSLETFALEQFMEKVEEIERGNAEAYLRQKQYQLATADLPIHIQTVLGLEAESILDYAAANQIDLIAMASHGRSGVSRWVYGSVAEKVQRGAPCATFIVRGREEATSH
jgi:nucleotide-binding universal stress UspA family protein